MISLELEPVTVIRGENDRKGNANRTPQAVVDVAFAWGTSGRSTGRYTSSNDRQESADITSQVYVPYGEDVRARDRIERSNGERYSVIGHPLWWQPNELEVFGSRWVVFQVEAMNG
jgi:hypothetical protein